MYTNFVSMNISELDISQKYLPVDEIFSDSQNVFLNSNSVTTNTIK